MAALAVGIRSTSKASAAVGASAAIAGGAAVALITAAAALPLLTFSNSISNRPNSSNGNNRLVAPLSPLSNSTIKALSAAHNSNRHRNSSSGSNRLGDRPSPFSSNSNINSSSSNK